MRQDSVYNTKNIFLLTVIFIVIFALLYALGSFLHEKQKIDEEILAIRQENEAYLDEIEQKKRDLEYLKTPQRLDKEAKIQIGKKQAGEQVIVFIEETLTPQIETTVKSEEELFQSQAQKEVSTPQKWWQWFLQRGQQN